MPVQHRLRNSSLFCFRLRSLDESTTEHHTTNNLPKCQAGAHSADFSREGILLCKFNSHFVQEDSFLSKYVMFEFTSMFVCLSQNYDGRRYHVGITWVVTE